MLDVVASTPAADFLDLAILSRNLSSGSGIRKEFMARRTSRGAGNGAGVPSHGGRCRFERHDIARKHVEVVNINRERTDEVKSGGLALYIRWADA